MKKITAKRLYELRSEKKLSLVALGEILGVSRATLGFYENEERTPDLNFLDKACDFFGVTADYLLGRTDNRKPENFNASVELGLNDEAIENIKSLDKDTKRLFNDFMENTNCITMFNILAFNLFSNVDEEPTIDPFTKKLNVIAYPDSNLDFAIFQASHIMKELMFTIKLHYEENIKEKYGIEE